MTNLAFLTDSAIKTKEYKYGLGNYMQANCQCSLTDKGFRIYRPPNKTVSADGNTMWGGLKLDFVGGLGYDVFVKGHTYILAMDVSGQSSNSSYIDFHSNMGWSSGGLVPQPTVTERGAIPSNFKGNTTVYCKWTINDDVYKVCTSSYSSFVKGNTYLSYRHISLGWGYSDTGTLGTDIYVNNIRLYDITGNSSGGGSICKNGVITNLSIYEKEDTQASINGFSEINVNDLIEY